MTEMASIDFFDFCCGNWSLILIDVWSKTEIVTPPVLLFDDVTEHLTVLVGEDILLL